ncbi:sigma factor-like helix-turn-helix DNA-binding protein [Rhodococcus pyridinivorans]|uniref:sigma factor-like helix-turn-helix DNA-binding protein n=1 Tax=Rhodococcus pyridinivorans TaxID=103816 RepID=UPI00265AB615|nr:sigma factor-like helix-turn-helix DNA-binding protein [Rhodococcus pyridinivorans]
MSAETPVRRNRTARELADRLGISPRTVRKIMAEPRGEYEARAAERRQQAVELRAQGLKYREIAEEMGIQIGAVGKLLHDARKAEAAQPAS